MRFLGSDKKKTGYYASNPYDDLEELLTHIKED